MNVLPPIKNRGIIGWFDRLKTRRDNRRQANRALKARQAQNIMSLADDLVKSACETREPESRFFRVNRYIMFGGKSKRWIAARLKTELDTRLKSFVLTPIETDDPAIIKVAIGDVAFIHGHRPAVSA